MKRSILAVAALAALAIPSTAAAHVTLQPDEAPAGGFARLDVRVPNEQADASTTKVSVKLPPGFVFVSYEPVAGWDVTVKKEKLSKPVTVEGEKQTEQVSEVIFTGKGSQGKIAPGQFQDFGLSVGLPQSAKAGSKLTFPAVQTYDNGDAVRWIGKPESEEPAPQVSVTAAEGEHGAAAQPAAAQSDDKEDSDGAPTWLVIVALVLGAGGLVVGAAGLVAARRPRAT